MQDNSVLVIIPAYNEAESICETVRSVEQAGYDYVVVNDGSTDSTLEICLSNGFNVLNLTENLGIGGAVQAGHKYAVYHGYQIDVQFDGDGQHDASYISVLVEDVLAGSDLAVGSRFLKKTDGFQSSALRRVGIKWISFLIRVLTGSRATDPTSGFRACSRRCMNLFCRDYPTDYPEPESIVAALKNGLAVNDVPVIMHERSGGKSSIGAFSSVYYMIKVSLAIVIVGLSRKRNF